MQMAMNKVKEIVSSHPVVVFSKTYCGFCQRVKESLTQLGAGFKVVELNETSKNSNLSMPSTGIGTEIQSALAEWTGQRTVPDVFIGGKNIGGYDRVMEIHQQEKLVPLLTQAGAVAKNPAQL